jgi:hypothetical protein
VVETSAHPINGRRGGSGAVSPWYPCGADFPADPCRSELASDRGIHAQSDRRLLRRNALNVVIRSHSWWW